MEKHLKKSQTFHHIILRISWTLKLRDTARECDVKQIKFLFFITLVIMSWHFFLCRFLWVSLPSFFGLHLTNILLYFWNRTINEQRVNLCSIHSRVYTPAPCYIWFTSFSKNMSPLHQGKYIFIVINDIVPIYNSPAKVTPFSLISFSSNFIYLFIK